MDALIIRSQTYDAFLPECDFMSWGRPVEKKCPRCGGYMVEKGNKLACADEHCGYTEAKEKETE